MRELFDLKKDPKELTSVYGQPEYADVQKELEAEPERLRQELKVPEDKRPLPGEKKAKLAEGEGGQGGVNSSVQELVASMDPENTKELLP
ncbi:MAG: DUF4976 domain-containing protein [Verrucomicrobiales bacterium]